MIVLGPTAHNLAVRCNVMLHRTEIMVPNSAHLKWVHYYKAQAQRKAPRPTQEAPRTQAQKSHQQIPNSKAQMALIVLGPTAHNLAVRCNVMLHRAEIMVPNRAHFKWVHYYKAQAHSVRPTAQRIKLQELRPKHLIFKFQISKAEAQTALIVLGPTAHNLLQECLG